MWNLKSNQTIVGDSIIRKPLVVFWILLKYMRCTHLSLRMICEVVFCAVWRLKYWELPSLYVSVFSRNPFIGGVIHHHNFWPFLFFPNLHINTSQCHTLWKLILSVGVKKISSFIHMNHEQQCLMFLYIIKTIFSFHTLWEVLKKCEIAYLTRETFSLLFTHLPYFYSFVTLCPNLIYCSSGFYHDPNAGWYYSSRDGLYYKFENGNYVLLESDRVSFSSSFFFSIYFLLPLLVYNWSLNLKFSQLFSSFYFSFFLDKIFFNSFVSGKLS